MTRAIVCAVAALLALLAVTVSAQATLVWESTFDVDADGVVDLFDNNPMKEMIGPVSGGRLQINAMDYTGGLPDKAGRPLGATLSVGDSMSAQYRFQWSALNTVEAQAFSYAGFMGGAAPSTRQALGTVLRHWRLGSGDHYVTLDIMAQGAGFTNPGYKAGGALWLGTDPLNQDFELRLEYDASTTNFRVTLLGDEGTLIGEHIANLFTDLPGLHQLGTPQQELGSWALTHLGWSDYFGNGGNRQTIWQVDYLAYFDGPEVTDQPIPLLPGDANRDGRVDGEDFLIWQASFSMQEGATWDDGDFNGDGRVDGEDFLIWQAHFGSVAEPAAVAPEPAALSLLGVAGLLLCRCKRTS